MDVQRKLEILADAAKYDASCASEQRDSSDGKGLGSTAPGMGICHSYAPDGRWLLRVPGFGRKAVDRIIATRRLTSIRVIDLGRLHIPRQKALPFIVLADRRPSPRLLDATYLVQRFKPKAAQLGFGF
jgi:predicted DNA-binding helix-hairpin-helix protein